MSYNCDVKFLGPIYESKGLCSLFFRVRVRLQLCCSLVAPQHATIIKLLLCFSEELHAALVPSSEGWFVWILFFVLVFCLFIFLLEAHLKIYIDKELQISFGQPYCCCHSYPFESQHVGAISSSKESAWMLLLPDLMLTCTDLLQPGAGTHQNRPLCLCHTFTVFSCGSCDPPPMKGLSHLPLSSETPSFLPAVCPLSNCSCNAAPSKLCRPMQSLTAKPPLKRDLLYLPEHFGKDCSSVQMFAVQCPDLLWWWLYETVMCWWKGICVHSYLLAGAPCGPHNGIATGQWDLPKAKKWPEFRGWLSHQLFISSVLLILFCFPNGLFCASEVCIFLAFKQLVLSTSCADVNFLGSYLRPQKSLFFPHKLHIQVPLILNRISGNALRENNLL